MNPSRAFPRRNRLTDAASFRRVFEQAGRSRDKYFTVLYRRSGRPEARLGLAIAKKYCRLATGRNRIKRIVRESFRMHQDELTGIDIVVLNRADTHSAARDELLESLCRHWRRCASAPRTDGEPHG